jgi:uncharacterized protein (DUF362 family)
MPKAKVIIKKLNAPHQHTSLKNYLPLQEKMVAEIRRTVKEIFDELGGATLIKSSGDVYIKPNAIDGKAYCYTRIEVLEAVISYWQKAGARKVFVLENSTQANYTRVVYAVNGYAKLCRKLGVVPIYLDEEKTKTFTFSGRPPVGSLNPKGYDRTACAFPLTVVEKLIDGARENLYVDLPKLKTHSMAGVTLGVKNQWGFPVHTSRGFDHNYNLFSKLADVLSMVRPDVTLIEGVEGTIYGHYPVTALADTCVKPFRLLIGSRNVVAADIFGSMIFGLGLDDVPHLKEAVTRGLGEGVNGPEDIECIGDITSLDGIDLIGDMPPEGKYPTDLYDSYPADVKIIVGKTMACKEGCMNNPRTLLQVLYHDYQGKGGWTLIIGKGFNPDEIDALQGRVLIAGHCAIEEVGERLIKRLGRRKVYQTGECNDLCSSVNAMCHLMKVNPMVFIEPNLIGALVAFAVAFLKGSSSRVPNPFCHLIKVV